MDSEALEREIVGLFLLQLPSIVGLLKSAADQADWTFATHTLKGSAAAIGALRITDAAKGLEAMTFTAGGADQQLMNVLDKEIASFRKAARRIYR